MVRVIVEEHLQRRLPAAHSWFEGGARRGQRHPATGRGSDRQASILRRKGGGQGEENRRG